MEEEEALEEEEVFHVRLSVPESEREFDVYVGRLVGHDRSWYGVTEVEVDDDGDVVSSRSVASSDYVFDRPFDALVEALRSVVVDELGMAVDAEHAGEVGG